MLSPKVVSVVLQWGTSNRREKTQHIGIDFGKGLRLLVDLLVADDLLKINIDKSVLIKLLDELVVVLGKVGLFVNAAKLMVLTTKAQPPSELSVAELKPNKVTDEAGVVAESEEHVPEYFLIPSPYYQTYPKF